MFKEHVMTVIRNDKLLLSKLLESIDTIYTKQEEYFIYVIIPAICTEVQA